MLRDEVSAFLRAKHIRLNTDAGQHFLIDQDTLDEIICAAALNGADHVVEIGPGIGILTKELLKRVGHVTAIEIDARFPPLLKSYVGDASKLTIITGNALQERVPEETFKVVANIPYHITSPLLHRFFLENPVLPTSMTLLIQREVAENIASKGSDSILTVLTHLFGTPKLLRLVPPGAFIPPPAVDSAVLHIDCHKEPIVPKEKVHKILGVAKLAMSKRRKMLSNTIGTLPNGDEAMAKANIDPKRRPQTLSIQEWIGLEKALHGA